MKIQIIDLPIGIPWVIGPAGELLINGAVINDVEESYNEALEEYYSYSSTCEVSVAK